MSETPVFLKLDHVLKIHQRMISEFGGDPAVRDPGLLESAVMMPGARFSGEFVHDGIPSMAAAYLFHIVKNHPFIDGNKRAGAVSALVFLALNGVNINADEISFEKMVRGVAEGKIDKASISDFFRKHC